MMDSSWVPFWIVVAAPWGWWLARRATRRLRRRDAASEAEWLVEIALAQDRIWSEYEEYRNG